MTEVWGYKPGYSIFCEDPWTNNGVTVRSRVTVSYTVDDVDDPEEFAVGIVIFEYIKEYGFAGLLSYRWIGKPCWDDPDLKSTLYTWEQCIYNAVKRFELHEARHWLKRPDGTHLIDPHPE